MSVRVADRGLSRMEYVHNAQTILYIIIERINKYVNKAVMNKKHKQLVKMSLYPLWNSPIYHAQLVYKYSELAYMKRKTREISALSLKDRIVHKCLCDYYLTPLLTKSLIHDCGATLKGKGLAFTRKRVVCHLQRYYRQNGNNKGYVLKADFHHYFENIKHDILINQLSKIVKDKETLEFIKYLIPTDLKGLGLGSQMSQICALYYVSKLDHYLKEKMRFKFYGRYMDDIYIISHHKNKLYKAKTYLKSKLQKLGVELNENKTHIYSLDKGFVFCKTRYKLTESGKVLKLIASKTLSSFNRKAKNGHDIIPSKLGYYMQFNCYRLAL